MPKSRKKVKSGKFDGLQRVGRSRPGHHGQDAAALGERTWTCAGCGAQHDRDVNAAINLQRLATGALAARTALPEASHALTRGAARRPGPARGAEVTPVRHEHGQQDGSGQEENAVRICTRNR
ncbi:zinc ribbon domain-containing protein [Telluria antibiotica]|uniref:zinc ribbon domain-containing protein n=1 Tax=Telluria antibiotica TaxID=2717319 RepID=UPI001E553056|nr:zinc ribbon domain-containing protein [Telluria antibiotica]